MSNEMEQLPPEDSEVDIDDSYPEMEFVTGRAGTGKTFLVRKRMEELGEGRHILCATTGIAAVNLGEGVLTLNSLLKYFDTHSLNDNWVSGFLEKCLRDLYMAGVERLVIDEVSMMDGKQLQLLVWAVDQVNEWVEDHYPEGRRLKITLTGDFCQLPPVKAKFAFEMPEWQRFEQNITMLEKVWRQEDAEFLHALNEARAGRGARAVEFFSQFCWPHQDPEYQGTTLLAKNQEVDRFNRTRLAEVSGEAATFSSHRWGKQRSEWKSIPEQLALKVGALVMVLANKKLPKVDEYSDDAFEYVNGDLGEIVEVGEAYQKSVNTEDKPIAMEFRPAYVRLHRTQKVVRVDPITRDNKVPLEVGRRKQLRAEGKEDKVEQKYEIVGGLTYTPLRLAYATTVHKSQGLTLDEVQIDFRNHFYAMGGMLYVALSRCRTAKGLRLVGKPETFVQRCSYNKLVKRWV